MLQGVEKRNAQKLKNYINVANSNVHNKDIYYFLKINAKRMFHSLKLFPQDYEEISGHISAFAQELAVSKWDINLMNPKRYEDFLNEFYKNVNFNDIDAEFMLECKDLLEISPLKNDLYKRRMDYFNKFLPIKMKGPNPPTTNTQNKNNIIKQKTNLPKPKPNPIIQQTNNVNNVNSAPVNPFEAINNANSDPYSNLYGNPYGDNNNTVSIEGNQGNMNEPMQNNALRGQNNNMNYDNMYNQGGSFSMEKKIPVDLKNKIINELKKCSDEIGLGKIENSKKHAVEVLLLFKQVFPE
jgi:hypothetical protein